MSGGVDSSVAAALLLEQGYEVIGAMMKIWDGRKLPEEGAGHSCYGPGELEDLSDAQKVSEFLGIKFFALDLSRAYNEQVLDPFCREYLCGRTPNPCVICNHKMKFGELPRKISEAGIEFDFFATGHYSRVEYDPGRKRYLLKKALDLSKDQTYFLYHLSQDQLSRTLFPLGDLRKEQVRKIAEKLGLPVAFKKESQDFIAGSDYSILFPQERHPGPILDQDGNQIGEHRGIMFYTIGQRKGLRITAKEPLYVIRIDPEKNAVIAGPREKLFQRELRAVNLNWIAMERPTENFKARGRIRQQHREAEAEVVPEGALVRVTFDQPQMAVTPGQAVVFYQDDLVLGGGTIGNSGDERMDRNPGNDYPIKRG